MKPYPLFRYFRTQIAAENETEKNERIHSRAAFVRFILFNIAMINANGRHSNDRRWTVLRM